MTTVWIVIDEDAEGSGDDVFAYYIVAEARERFDAVVARRKAEGWEVWSHVRHADRMIMENAEGERRTIEIIATTEGH